MKDPLKFAIGGVVLGLIASFALPSLAQSPAPGKSGDVQRTVSVSGTGIVRSAPDEAVVSLGVQTQAASAEAAIKQNAARIVDVVQALMADGIKKDDLATSNISLYPTYDSKGIEVTGYTASDQLDVTVRDISKVGPVIDDAVTARANLVGGVTFRVSDRNEGVGGALQAAVADARGKAEVLAAAADARLGRVVSIVETSAITPPPIFAERAAAAESTPILPPTIETQVSVTVVWELI